MVHETSVVGSCSNLGGKAADFQDKSLVFIYLSIGEFPVAI